MPANAEGAVQSLGEEDPLEKETATHSSILPWEIPWTEETGGLQSTESQKSQTQLSDEHTHTYLYSLVVRNLPGMQVIQVQSLSWEDSLEEEMATHSSILPWEIPWIEEPGWL